MALLTGSARDNLPDSDFAYIEPGGSKDSSGKTTPRSKRHFPIQDAEHVRDALARIAQGAQFGQDALPKVRAAAKRFGIDSPAKSAPGFEVKSFAFKMDAPPDEEGRFSGYAAVFGNVDRGNDLIEPGAVTKTLQENPEVPLYWQHDYTVVPIGVGQLTPDPNGRGVRIDGKLFIETSERAREVFGAMKAKAVKGLSIGYNTFKRAFEGKVRRLQEIGIAEVSLCNAPMNPLATIDAVKGFLGQYGATEEVDCLLSVIGSLADYLASEVAEGDSEDVARVQKVLPILAQCLASELSDVATEGDDDGNSSADYSDATEMMRAPIELAVKKLQALLEHAEPAAGHSDAGAAGNATEPDVSTLRALMADIGAYSTRSAA